MNEIHSLEIVNPFHTAVSQGRKIMNFKRNYGCLQKLFSNTFVETATKFFRFGDLKGFLTLSLAQQISSAVETTSGPQKLFKG